MRQDGPHPGDVQQPEENLLAASRFEFVNSVRIMQTLGHFQSSGSASSQLELVQQ